MAVLDQRRSGRRTGGETPCAIHRSGHRRSTLGRGAPDSLAVRYATVLATELGAVGINLDWAPVLDVNSNPANPVIGDRALSSDPEVVGRLGAAIVRTLQAEGVTACGKHFPGHGDTSVDSHEALPIVEHDRRRLEAVEFVPFRAAIAADVAAIMTAHVLVPAIDRDAVASFSSRVVTDVLKNSLGFRGVVVSDDLGMKAVSAGYASAGGDSCGQSRPAATSFCCAIRLRKNSGRRSKR